MERAPGKLLLLISGIVYTTAGVLGLSSILFFSGFLLDLRRFFKDQEVIVKAIDGLVRFPHWLRELFDVHGTAAENSDLIFVAFLASAFALAVGFVGLVMRKKGEGAFKMIQLGVLALILNGVMTYLDGFILINITPLSIVFAAIFWVAPVCYIAGAVMNHIAHVRHMKKLQHYVSVDTLEEH
jgi:hypothetical protein